MSKGPCVRAPVLLRNGELKKGLEALNRCKKDIRRNLRKNRTNPELRFEYSKQMIRALRLELEAQHSLGSISRVKKTISEAFSVINSIEKDDEVFTLAGYFHFSMATIELIGGNRDEAIILFEKSKEQHLQAKNYFEVVNIDFNIADLALKIPNHDLTREKIKSIGKNYKKIKDKQTKNVTHAKVILLEGKLHEILKEHKKAQILFTKARKIYSKAKDPAGEAQAIIELSNTFSDSDLKKTEEYLLQGLDLAKMSESKMMQGIILTRLGIISLKSGRHEEGKRRLLNGLKYRTEAGDKKGTASTLLELARISMVSAQGKDDFKNSMTLANQSFELYSELGDQHGLAHALEILATVNTKLGQFAKAEKQITESRKIFKSFGDINSEGRVLTQLAIILSHKTTEEAAPVFAKAMKLFEKTGNGQGKAELLQFMAYAENDSLIAIKLLEESKSIYLNINLDKTSLSLITKSLDKRISDLEIANNGN
ncbi:MAG: hypothetical protein IH840_07090 [Candidatus Heimdallarchaeota archaeon]|nr:hypothetical protein [Candidatus Heimdallarchaeota archaeon]